jgi:hypothetical protein
MPAVLAYGWVYNRTVCSQHVAGAHLAQAPWLLPPLITSSCHSGVDQVVQVADHGGESGVMLSSRQYCQSTVDSVPLWVWTHRLVPVLGA